jgi:hypothetical protein
MAIFYCVKALGAFRSVFLSHLTPSCGILLCDIYTAIKQVRVRRTEYMKGTMNT